MKTFKKSIRRKILRRRKTYKGGELNKSQQIIPSNSYKKINQQIIPSNSYKKINQQIIPSNSYKKINQKIIPITSYIKP